MECKLVPPETAPQPADLRVVQKHAAPLGGVGLVLDPVGQEEGGGEEDDEDPQRHHRRQGVLLRPERWIGKF